MKVRITKMLSVLMMAALLVAASAASVFASEGPDWSSGTITVEGTGVAPTSAMSGIQARMLARRAAVVDAYRQMAEIIKGVNVDSDTTVENMMVTSDVTKTHVSALIRGAKIVSEKALDDGGYMVTMEIPMYGASNSLASAVLTPSTVKESFPEPQASVAPSQPVGLSGTTMLPSTTEGKLGSSAAAAPAGKAVGGFTGLIVDCRGLGLKPVMSPVIRNDNGQPIYGYKNLDSQTVIANGMASYVSDISRATRAGSNPLVVKAVSVTNHSGDPVISVPDANRVLIENGATGFLDRTNVVFLR
ncbi:LPP20 family lipoprotein [Mitsuokella sp. AF21-1AC]|uniref:LPP20 family lipoprotein n=1 Tax=Mitsuokella sp. AF21-1AC TaxID=2292235 RepID=UPI000E4F743F|nr:LPP20 family lipoprotein [Mitsuokella sp. AF21-1AC]RGS70757.1 hypothetical protein DWX75_10140 [Mitsuokella sp. AF21-1AC]